MANVHGGLKRTRRDKLAQCFNKDTRLHINQPQERKERVERKAKNAGLFQGQESLKNVLKEANKDRTYLEKALQK